MQVITRKEAKAQGLKRYFNGKPCKQGHIAERSVSNGGCVCCRKKYLEENKKTRAESARRWREENKQYVLEYRRNYYEKNKEYLLELGREWREENKEYMVEYRLKYYEENKDAVLERVRKWLNRNPVYVFIRRTLERTQSNWKGSRAKYEKILGYTCRDLRRHIERQFQEGMSWDNRSEWHIDHIKPIKAFLDEGITDPAIINALSNLQPLWATDNLSKGAAWRESKKATANQGRRY